MRGLVFRADRAEQHRPSVAQSCRLFQRLRVGLDREAMRIDGCGRQPYVRIDRRYALFVGEQGIDVEFDDLGQVDQ